MKIQYKFAIILFLMGIGGVIKSNGEQCSAQGCPAKIKNTAKKEKSPIGQSETIKTNVTSQDKVGQQCTSLGCAAKRS